jgi:hypothetical protein
MQPLPLLKQFALYWPDQLAGIATKGQIAVTDGRRTLQLLGCCGIDCLAQLECIGFQTLAIGADLICEVLHDLLPSDSVCSQIGAGRRCCELLLRNIGPS